jgi:hypothetical protein
VNGFLGGHTALNGTSPHQTAYQPDESVQPIGEQLLDAFDRRDIGRRPRDTAQIGN